MTTLSLSSLVDSPEQITTPKADYIPETAHSEDSPLQHAVHSVPTSVESKYGIWLDERVVIKSPRALDFVKAVVEVIAPFEHRQRKHRAIDLDNHHRRVGCILANALRAHYFREPPIVAYNKTPNAYSKRVDWFSATTLGKCIKALVAAGLIAERPGKWSGFSPSFDGTASTFWVQPSLIDLADQFDLSFGSISMAVQSDDTVVRLRGPKDEYGKADELGFERDPSIESWIEDLCRWNEAAHISELSLEVSVPIQSKIVRQFNANLASWREPKLKQLELFDSTLVRIFNEGSFDRGGRMYGGWWQSIPASFRSAIMIDGEETIELDYSGMSVRMLYHLYGIEYGDDPYALPELENYALEQGLPANHFRPAIKQYFAAMLNGDAETHFEKVRLSRSFEPKFRRHEIQSMIERKHHPIASEFQRGIGLWLQRLDSDIALDVMTGLLASGVLALPVHDSFIVKKRFESELKAEMIRAYQSKMGFSPIIH